jgi:hypothetical protein
MLDALLMYFLLEYFAHFQVFKDQIEESYFTEVNANAIELYQD